MRNIIIKNAVAAGLLWLLLLAAPCAALPPPAGQVHTKVTGDLVNVAVDFGYASSDVPLNVLRHALASYPRAHRFRVTWTYPIMLDGVFLTAVYDRPRQSVTVYRYYTEGENSGRVGLREHLRYTKVQERDFAKIAAAHKGDQSDWDWFSDLPKYGCRKHELSYRRS